MASSSTLHIPRASDSLDHPPADVTGLLSRTVFLSPEINRVFPIRIRSWEKQDVALIGDHFVHIKQVQNNGRLLHIATKADFPSRIRAAEVLGSETAVEPENEDTKGPRRHAHTLVLTLDSAELVFVTMTEDIEGRDVFKASSLPLTAQRGPLYDPGLHLTVDPFSRAFAVAAPSKTLEIFEMTPRDQWDSTSPFAENIRKHEVQSVNMDIAKTVFLYPPENQALKIYLLVLGYSRSRSQGLQKGRIALELYTWEYQASAELLTIPQTLPKELLIEHGVPQMLIPLSRWPGGFVLVCTESIAIYQQAHLGHPVRRHRRSTRSLNREAPSLNNDINEPLWKAWARPPRRGTCTAWSGNAEVTESLYLAREDGVLLYLDVMLESNRIASETFAGNLNGNLEHAFNHDGKSLGDPDGLIYGGSVSDGGVYLVGGHNENESREHVMTLRQTETIYNWAPFLDIASDGVESSPNSNNVHGKLGSGHDLYGTSGRSPYGAISQIRYGCEAAVQSFLGDPEENPMAATHMWSFRTSQGLIVTLLSTPERTELVYDQVADQGEPSILELTQGETLAATKVAILGYPELQGDFFIRIGTDSISLDYVVRPDHHGDAKHKSTTSVAVPGIMAAAIEPAERVILIATGSEMAVYQIRQTNPNEGPVISIIDSPKPLKAEITCATLFGLQSTIKTENIKMEDGVRFNQDVYGVLGTSSGQIMIFPVSASEGLSSGPQLIIDDLSMTAESPVPSSVAVVEGPNSVTTLLCGTRDGQLCAISLRREQNSTDLHGSDKIRMRIGSSAMHFTNDKNSPSAAIVTCDGRAMRLTYNHCLIEKPRIDYIHVTQQEDRSYTPQAITAISRVPADPAIGEPAHLMCTTGGQLLTSTLDEIPKALPLRLPVPGTPTRIIYSEFFRVFFVASTVYHVHGTKRWSIPTIFSIDPKSKQPQALALEQLGAGRKISCLTEWKFVKDDGNKKSNGASSGRVYRHLVVTTIDTEGTNETMPAGSLLFYKISSADELSLELVSEKQERHPVWSICQFDNETLVYGCADAIKQRKYYPEEKRDKRMKLLDLGALNEPRFITAKPPFIYVSTAHGSFRTFHLDATANKLTPIYSDSDARDGLAHLTLPFPTSDHASPPQTLALFTDKRHFITGQLQPSSTQPTPLNANETLSTLPPSFSTHLPVSITRLHPNSPTPPWRASQILPPHLPPLNLSILTPHAHILGTATNGSLYAFTTLSAPLWRLLRFIQNLCARNPELSFLSTAALVMKRRHIEPAATRSTDFSVDGDLLLRLVERRDACEVLKRMVDALVPAAAARPGHRRARDGDDDVDMDMDVDMDADGGGGGVDAPGQATDYDSATARRARFEVLVTEVVERGCGGVEAVGGAYECVELAIELMRVVLERPL